MAILKVSRGSKDSQSKDNVGSNSHCGSGNQESLAANEPTCRSPNLWVLNRTSHSPDKQKRRSLLPGKLRGSSEMKETKERRDSILQSMDRALEKTPSPKKRCKNIFRKKKTSEEKSWATLDDDDEDDGENDLDDLCSYNTEATCSRSSSCSYSTHSTDPVTPPVAPRIMDPKTPPVQVYRKFAPSLEEGEPHTSKKRLETTESLQFTPSLQMAYPQTPTLPPVEEKKTPKSAPTRSKVTAPAPGIASPRLKRPSSLRSLPCNSPSKTINRKSSTSSCADPKPLFQRRRSIELAEEPDDGSATTTLARTIPCILESPNTPTTIRKRPTAKGGRSTPRKSQSLPIARSKQQQQPKAPPTSGSASSPAPLKSALKRTSSTNSNDSGISSVSAASKPSVSMATTVATIGDESSSTHTTRSLHQSRNEKTRPRTEPRKHRSTPPKENNVGTDFSYILGNSKTPPSPQPSTPRTSRKSQQHSPTSPSSSVATGGTGTEKELSSSSGHSVATSSTQSGRRGTPGVLTRSASSRMSILRKQEKERLSSNDASPSKEATDGLSVGSGHTISSRKSSHRRGTPRALQRKSLATTTDKDEADRSERSTSSRSSRSRESNLRRRNSYKSKEESSSRSRSVSPSGASVGEKSVSATSTSRPGQQGRTERQSSRSRSTRARSKSPSGGEDRSRTRRRSRSRARSKSPSGPQAKNDERQSDQQPRRRRSLSRSRDRSTSPSNRSVGTVKRSSSRQRRRSTSRSRRPRGTSPSAGPSSPEDDKSSTARRPRRRFSSTGRSRRRSTSPPGCDKTATSSKSSEECEERRSSSNTQSSPNQAQDKKSYLRQPKRASESKYRDVVAKSLTRAGVVYSESTYTESPRPHVRKTISRRSSESSPVSLRSTLSSTSTATSDSRLRKGGSSTSVCTSQSCGKSVSSKRPSSSSRSSTTASRSRNGTSKKNDKTLNDASEEQTKSTVSSKEARIMREHSRVVGDLERLIRSKTNNKKKSTAESASATTADKLEDSQLRARLQLFTALEDGKEVENFQKLYRLDDNDMMILRMHIQFCQELNECVRWDLIFQLLFPDNQGSAGAGKTLTLNKAKSG